ISFVDTQPVSAIAAIAIKKIYTVFLISMVFFLSQQACLFVVCSIRHKNKENIHIYRFPE
ncbi:MAG: hypothetical protein WBI58_08855, partial [Dysgonamonadaceae bacterium]